MTSSAVVAEDLEVGLADLHELDLLGLGADARVLDGLVHRRGQVHQTRLVEGVGHLQPRQLDDLLDELAQPGGLDLHAPGEPLDGLGVVAGVEHCLGQQRQATDRGLELVADVGDEVAADLLQPAGLGGVVEQQQHVAAAQRRHPRVHGDPAATHRPPGQVELGLADDPVAAHLAREVAQLGVRQLAALDQAVGGGGRGGVDDLVGGVDDDPAGAQHRQDVCDAGRDRRGLGRLGDVALLALGVPHRDDREHTDHDPGESGQQGGGGGIHDTQCTQSRHPARPLGLSHTGRFPYVHLESPHRSRPRGSLTSPPRAARTGNHTCATRSTRTSTRSPTSWSR